MKPPTVPGVVEPPGTLLLRLYVAGSSANSQMALANLRRLLRGRTDPMELEIVDLLLNPERGLPDGIMVTPTLLKLAPAPQRKIIGSLNDAPVVLDALGLQDDTHV
ncbi:MAG TPA: circadian clock KaiB family protein [Polyangiaceae bacterium]|nr:circadian clock KaiB family protein [Polyangiaceae bacterium]